MSGSNSELINALSGGGLLSSLAHPAQINLLGAYHDAAGAADAIWRTRKWQAEQAAGQAQLGGIGPDGVFSQNRANQGMGPNAALAAGQTLESNQRLSNSQLEQAFKTSNWINTAAGAALKAGDYSDAGMLKILQDGAASGILTMPQIMQQMQTMPADPAGRKLWLEQHQGRAMSTQQQLEQQYGTRQAINTGGATVFPVVPPASAGGAGPTVPMTMTPEGKGAPTPGPATATGADTSISRSEYMRQRGLDPDTGNPIANPAFKDLPSSLRNPNAPPLAAIPPTQTGAAPADKAALGASGIASSEGYTGISGAATKAVGRRSLLQNMAGDATQFTTGAGADRIKAMKSAVLRVGGMFGLSPVDAGKLAANEDLDKVAAQLADAQGAGSDARLMVNQGANPSSHNSPAGLRLILNKLVGNEDYNVFKGQAAAQYQKTQDPTGAKVRDFEAHFRDEFDPRVFQFNRMNREQQAQYMTELGDGKDAFKRSYLKTRAAGVLPGG